MLKITDKLSTSFYLRKNLETSIANWIWAWSVIQFPSLIIVIVKHASFQSFDFYIIMLLNVYLIKDFHIDSSIVVLPNNNIKKICWCCKGIANVAPDGERQLIYMSVYNNQSDNSVSFWWSITSLSIREFPTGFWRFKWYLLYTAVVPWQETTLIFISGSECLKSMMADRSVENTVQVNNSIFDRLWCVVLE